jgi:hypothetical protein
VLPEYAWRAGIGSELLSSPLSRAVSAVVLPVISVPQKKKKKKGTGAIEGEQLPSACDDRPV